MADATARFVVTAEDHTGTALRSADRNLQSLARGALRVRSTLAGFGVVLSGRAFASWMANAIQTTDAVGEQAVAVERAKEAFGEFKKASDSLAESFAIKMTPAVTLLSRAMEELRKVLAPTDSEMLDRQIAGMQDEIDRLIKGLMAFEQGKWWTRLGDTSMWEKNRAQIEQMRLELQKLYDERDRRRNPAPAFSGSDFFGGGPADQSQVEFQRKVLEQEAKAAEETRKRIAQGQALSPEIQTFVDQLQRGEQLTESMRTEVEKQVDAWRDAKGLFEVGAISAETLRRLDEEQLGEIKVTAKRIKDTFGEIKDEGSNAAEFLGESFRDAFSSWILGTERSFRDMLKRMAIEMATSALFQGLASFFPGGTFLSKFFGGSRASGGSTREGMVYKVHPGEAFFTPGQDGHVAAASGGLVINSSPTFNFSGGTPREQAAAFKSMLDERDRRLMGEIQDKRKRGRF